MSSLKTILSAVAAIALPSPAVIAQPPAYSHIGQQLTDGQHYSIPVNADGESYWIEARIAVKGNKERPGTSPKNWGFSWVDSNDGSTYTCKVGWGNTAFGSAYDKRYMSVSLIHGDNETVFEKTIESKVNLRDGYNSLAIYFDRSHTGFYIGDHLLNEIASISPLGAPADSVVVSGNGTLTLNEIRTRETPDKEKSLRSTWTVESLRERLTGTHDRLEGFWQYLDRDNDEARAMLGGRYTLAIVRNGTGYDIIYISGAKTWKERWHTGMIKGHLEPTIFTNNFNMTWNDTQLQPMGEDDELNASINDNGSILTLNFPIQSTSLRFSKQIIR